MALVASSCSPGSAPPPAATPTPAAKVALAAMPKIEAPLILEHIKKLASDEFEGRKPGLLAKIGRSSTSTAEFQKLGLKPGNTDGTYIQKVPLVGITGTRPSHSS